MDGSSVGESALAEAREEALRTALAWAPWALPPEQRPSSPFRHDRALLACAGLLRMLVRRTWAVETALRPNAPTGPHRGAFALDAVYEAVVACGAAPRERDRLRMSSRSRRRTAGMPTSDCLGCAMWSRQRRSWMRDFASGVTSPSSANRLTLSSSPCAVRSAPAPSPGPYSELSLSSPLWSSANRRLRCPCSEHAGISRRVRSYSRTLWLALGLAVARYLAGSFDLAHGSWVLLATLTLMRTTASATRSAMWPAFVGTLAGALITGGLLLAFGQDPDVFTVLMPIAFFASFSLGPLAGPFVGPAAGQFFMTLAVAALFVQVAPATWQLAEGTPDRHRVGGVVGSLVGLLVWPRGGSGEITRAVANTLHSASEHIMTTTRFLTGSRGSPLESTFRRTLQDFLLAGESLTQSLTEAGGERNGERWEAFVQTGNASCTVVMSYVATTPILDAAWQDMTAILQNLGGAIAQAAEVVSEEVRQAGTGQVSAVSTRTDEIRGWLIATVKGPNPLDTLRVLDTRTWLLDVATDLSEIVSAPSR